MTKASGCETSARASRTAYGRRRQIVRIRLRYLKAIEQGAHPGADPGPLRAHAADAVHFLSRGRTQHGGGSGGNADDRATGAGVRRLSSAQLRRFRDARTARDLSTSTTSTKRSPLPWEWDVKRLAASFVLACRDQRLQRRLSRGTRRCPACARIGERMAEYSRDAGFGGLVRAHRPGGSDPNDSRTRRPRKRVSEAVGHGSQAQRAGTRFSQAGGGRWPTSEDQGQLHR